MNTVQTLVEGARKQRLVHITYQKPGEREPTKRMVEPYAFVETRAENLLIKCIQVEPHPGENPWRTFRTDRIISAAITKVQFNPLREITIGYGEIESLPMRHNTKITNTSRYREFVVEAIWRGSVSIMARLIKARKLKKGLQIGQVRAVHASVYGDILEEFGEDGVIDDREVMQLASARKVLKKLGWAP